MKKNSSLWSELRAEELSDFISRSKQKGNSIQKKGTLDSVILMPYKDYQRYRKYMRNYMKRQRSLHAQAKRQMLRDIESMERLRKNFPTAYELLFGKQKRRK